MSFWQTYVTEEQVKQYIDSQIEGASVSADVTAFDLSAAAAETKYLLALNFNAEIKWILFIYSEASSADAGITMEIGYQALSGYATGRTTDRNYIAEYATEISKAQWYTKAYAQSNMLKFDLQKGEILTVYNPGGKTGTGALIVIVGFVRKL